MMHLNEWQKVLRDAGREMGVTPSVDRFFFLRHGQTDSNLNGVVQGWVDVPLNPAGEAQASVAAKILAGKGITRIISSPLSRALRTAEMVSSVIDAPIDRVDARLRERCFGDYEGEPSPSCAGGAWAREDRGAESYRDFAHRVASGLTDALAGGGVPLVVAHGGVRRVLLLTLGLDEPDSAYGNAVPMEFVRPSMGGTAGGWHTIVHAGALGGDTKSDA